jgi:hypothetical protein
MGPDSEANFFENVPTLFAVWIAGGQTIRVMGSEYINSPWKPSSYLSHSNQIRNDSEKKDAWQVHVDAFISVKYDQASRAIIIH